MSSTTDHIFMLHPSGKQKTDMLRTIDEQQGTRTFESMTDHLIAQLQPNFEGKVTWNSMTLKVELEARGIIKREPAPSPHRMR